ncbi:MAG: hypothetical protein QM796_01015 [Chthoniobacteraceae bacterium]
MKLRLLPLALVAAFAVAHPARATNPTTTVGFMSYTFPATTTATMSCLSVPLKSAAVFSGSPTAVDSSTITVDIASWTAGAFASTTPYYVIVKSGVEIGRILRITANTTTQLTVDTTDDSTQTTSLTTSGFALSTSDTFEIFPGYTFSTFFGSSIATIPLTVTGTPDTVFLWNWQTTQFEQYTFNTSAGSWQKFDGTNATNLPLPPNATIAISRAAGHVAAQFIVLGVIPTVTPLVKTPGGSTPRYYSNGLPADITLSQLSLGSNWKQGTTAFNSDTVSIYNGTTSLWNTYYQLSTGSWQLVGGTGAQDSTVIPAGSAIVFTKRTKVTGSASFLTVSLPYTP